MIYRDFGKTGLRVSAIGMGCEYVWTADEKQIFDLVRAAVDAGINYFDLFVGTPTTREYYGKALKGVRDKICLAGHLGCADSPHPQPPAPRSSSIAQFAPTLI